MLTKERLTNFCPGMIFSQLQVVATEMLSLRFGEQGGFVKEAVIVENLVCLPHVVIALSSSQRLEYEIF